MCLEKQFNIKQRTNEARVHLLAILLRLVEAQEERNGFVRYTRPPNQHTILMLFDMKKHAPPPPVRPLWGKLDRGGVFFRRPRTSTPGPAVRTDYIFTPKVCGGVTFRRLRYLIVVVIISGHNRSAHTQDEPPVFCIDPLCVERTMSFRGRKLFQPIM